MAFIEDYHGAKRLNATVLECERAGWHDRSEWGAGMGEDDSLVLIDLYRTHCEIHMYLEFGEYNAETRWHETSRATGVEMAADFGLTISVEELPEAVPNEWSPTWGPRPEWGPEEIARYENPISTDTFTVCGRTYNAGELVSITEGELAELHAPKSGRQYRFTAGGCEYHLRESAHHVGDDISIHDGDDFAVYMNALTLAEYKGGKFQRAKAICTVGMMSDFYGRALKQQYLGWDALTIEEAQAAAA